MADPGSLSLFRGISIGSLITGAGVWTGVIGLFGIILRSRVPMRKLKLDADTKLIDALGKRVDKLETDISDQRVYYETKIDRIEALNDARERIARHELNNVKMRLRALVMLLKRLPDPPPMLKEILADIEAMEAEQALTEAAEKGAQAGAKIAATIIPSA